MAAQLATSASTRLIQGFKPSTLKQYKPLMDGFFGFSGGGWAVPLSGEYRNFMEFSFMEFLYQNHLSSTHIAGLRVFHIVHGLQTHPFKDERIALFVKSTKIQAPLRPSVKSHIDVQTLDSIICHCQILPYPEIFKTSYLLCFFSFLRLSNILPHSMKSFDPSRQLARGDFIFSGEGAVLLIKWSKTMQDRKQSVTIPLPNLGTSHHQHDPGFSCYNQ